MKKFILISTMTIFILLGKKWIRYRLSPAVMNWEKKSFEYAWTLTYIFDNVSPTNKGGFMQKLDFDNIYQYHAPKEGQPTKYEAIRAKAKELALLIETSCPDSREKSVAFTNIETAVMWANASIARS